ncbi:hypothetical protein C8J56DRAFT_799953, partial [Mycena floridula]
IGFSRPFLSQTYGGSQRGSFPPISEERFQRHGYEDFAYPSSELNPHAPMVPGAPGLLFGVGQAYQRDFGYKRVVTGLETNNWAYMGQYELKAAKSLTKEEWNRQTPKVKNTWVSNLIGKKWGVGVRAHVVLRKKLGCDPT